MSKASLSLSLCTIGCLYASTAQAQVTSDGTVNTQVNQNGNIAEITGGETRGGNLFHSFQNFSVPINNEAFFNNAESIANIFSRVTGGNVSNIDGLIRANGSASLFLINPAGIVFGEGARLNIGGSFFGSTASSILFEGGEFSAVDNIEQPILTVNAPIGLNFRDNPGDITVRNDGNGARLLDSEVIDTQNALRVNSDATIGLVGGDILFEDATVKTAGGRIEIGSVAQGTVDLIAVDNGFTFDYSNIATFRDISLSGSSAIDASGLGGGDIQVVGNSISLSGISEFTANTLGSEPGGNINVFASDFIEISGIENELNFVSAISNQVFPGGTADAGDINIETGNLQIGDRALITTGSFGRGNAGNININASDSITLESQGNNSAIVSNVAEGAIGNSGDINLTTSSLTLNEGAFINANTSGQGNAGNININANETVSLDGAGTGFFTNVRTDETVGNGGNININTVSLNISNEAVLDATSFGQGNAGNITVNASDSIAIEGNDANNLGNTSISASVISSLANANAGNIEVNTGSLNLNNGAILAASSENTQNNGGNATINAVEDVSFANRSSIFVFGGQGGSIQLDAKNLSLTSGSSFFAGIPNDSGFTEAQSGDVNINLAEDLVLDELDSENSTFITNTSFGIGNPGDININARNITFRNGGNVSIYSTSQQDGNIGEVTLNARGNILFDGIGSVRSGILNAIPDQSSGDIGAINVQAQNLTLTNGGTIQSQVSGSADGGDININVVNSIEVDGFGENRIGLGASEISSNVVFTGTGNGGEININTQNLELSRNGFISADNAGQGNGGDININAEQITLGESGNPNRLPSFISAQTFAEAEGNGGNIAINTGSLFINDGSDIDVGLGGVGNGGNIKINARDIVSVDGISLDSESPSSIVADAFNSVGNAGNIEIDTAKLFVTDGAFVSADILSDGTVTNTANGGSITIRASDSVEVSGTGGIEVDVIPEDATGNGGNLTIETGKLTVEEGASISAISLGSGNAGSLTVNAESIFLSGFSETGRGGIFASALQGSGNGGDINIFTNDLTIADGASISASNFPSFENSTFTAGTGQPGDINIQASSISLENEGRIEAATQSEIGDAANIDLQVTEDITLQNNSFISARAFNDADGGNLNIDARYIIAFPSNGTGNDLVATADRAEGGNIDLLDVKGIFGLQPGNAIAANNEFIPNGTNDIDASSNVEGFNGTIAVDPSSFISIQGAIELPSNIVVPEETVAQACSSNRERLAQGGFTISGKGGIIPNPSSPLDALNVYVDGEDTQADISEAVETARGKIQPARGVRVTEKGIMLTAYRTNNAGDRLPGANSNCDRS